MTLKFFHLVSKRYRKSMENGIGNCVGAQYKIQSSPVIDKPASQTALLCRAGTSTANAHRPQPIVTRLMPSVTKWNIPSRSQSRDAAGEAHRGSYPTWPLRRTPTRPRWGVLSRAFGRFAAFSESAACKTVVDMRIFADFRKKLLMQGS